MTNRADTLANELPHHWGRLLALGLGLLGLGVVSLIMPVLTTLTSVVVYGWLLVLGGVFEAVAAFGAPRWTGVVLHLLSGIFGVIVGGLIVLRPDAGALALTLLLATFFFVGGCFRIGAALALRFPSSGWTIVSGVVNIVLGVMIWKQWPTSALWLIGTLVGVELVFRGWGWVMMSAVARRLATARQPEVVAVPHPS